MTPRLVVTDATAQVEFLRDVFDAVGDVVAGRPAEVRIGDSLIMVTPAGGRELFAGFLYIYVNDVDDVYGRALAAGALSLEAPLDTPYGDRRAMVRDPFGNLFQIAQRIAPANPPDVAPDRIDVRQAAADEGLARALADVLVDCVEGGASVSFMLPLDPQRAESYWQDMLDSASRGERILLVAEDVGTGDVVGTVQVSLITPENQPHRAEIAKMLVHRRARRRGVGDALMVAAEAAAGAAGKTLLVLDTSSADAARLYRRRGWRRVGEIPSYALWPGGGHAATTIFYKELTS